jgi:hypothetical protein
LASLLSHQILAQRGLRRYDRYLSACEFDLQTSAPGSYEKKGTLAIEVQFHQRSQINAGSSLVAETRFAFLTSAQNCFLVAW